MRKVDQIICEMHEWVFQMEKKPHEPVKVQTSRNF